MIINITSKFETLCNQHNVQMHNYECYEDFRTELNNDQIKRNAIRTDYFDIIEAEILNEEKELDIFLENKAHNLDNLNSLKEHQEIIKKLTQLTQFQNKNNTFCSGNDNNFNINNVINFENNLNNQNNTDIIYINNNDHITSHVNKNVEEGQGGLQFIAGVISSENELKLRRTVFRVSFGLGLTTFWDLNLDTISKIVDNEVINIPKKIFTIFLKNSDSNKKYLFGKLIKICDALGATRYNIPPPDALPGLLADIGKEIFKMERVLEEQLNSIRSLIIIKLGSPLQPSKYSLYRIFFKKQKEIYLNLSKCKSSNNFYSGIIWVMEKKVKDIEYSLKELENKSNNLNYATLNKLECINDDLPPTYIDTNEFLFPFQEIVNTYGIPRYQEINPTVFNIVTFPFLFGVMFGDIGHGLILLIFSIYLCIYSDEIKINKKSLLKPIVPGRYLLLFMGIFAFYSGWIYNEFFSVALPIFGGSCYTGEKPYKNELKEFYRINRGCIYPIGMDPKWQMSQNELSFNNSVKMKLSVILGVFHMLFGIVLKGFNCIHFKNYLGFIFEFIPQIIFMMILFGYMDVMIFIKWMRNWDNNEANAPSLITHLMNIFLKMGDVQNKPLWEDINSKEKYTQEKWHLIILVISMICIPLMLVPKPIIEYTKNTKRLQKQNYVNLSDERQLFEEEEVEEELASGESHNEDHGFSDIFVHQSIETIEFVLGAISNTASYLRLWALSLAHGQLSKVFFQNALLGALNSDNIIMGILKLLIGFFIFANVTFGVLLCMDLLECFLHTLRLHWVEFQNKFYKADGYKFTPFSFRHLLISQFGK